MSERNVFEEWKERGERVLGRLSADLMQNEHFVKAMQGALKGKERLDEAAAQALKRMNIPTRTEFKRALQRVEALEQELAKLKARKPAAPRRRGGRKTPA